MVVRYHANKANLLTIGLPSAVMKAKPTNLSWPARQECAMVQFMYGMRSQSCTVHPQVQNIGLLLQLSVEV
jgi:hypothetical protein